MLNTLLNDYGISPPRWLISKYDTTWKTVWYPQPEYRSGFEEPARFLSYLTRAWHFTSEKNVFQTQKFRLIPFN